MIEVPPETDAPVILPLLVPNVHPKLLEDVALRLMFGEFPLQIDAVTAEAIDGIGFTVTVISVALPTQFPMIEVGVTAYTIEPALLLLGLVNV